MSTSPVERLNNAVAHSIVGRWFKLQGSGAHKERIGSRFTTEIRAGLTTWAAMAYIISVNASIISDSGGPCVCPTNDMCLSDQVYLGCVAAVRQDMITATAGIAALSSFLMGLLANLPIALAPGLSLNSYFAYSVVGYHGSGILSYSEALSAVFLEGWIFMALSLLGIRQLLVRMMPPSLILAVGSGIGVFIAFIGLSSNGLGVIGGSTTTLVTLGGCTANNYVNNLPHFCAQGLMRNPTMWLGIFLGGILTTLLMLYRVRGAILIGIVLTSVVSWPRPTPVTYFPYTSQGDELFNYFKQIVSFRSISLTDHSVTFDYDKVHVWYALITFLYVDLLDTTGTLYSMARFAGLRDPITMDFENSTIAYCIDAFSISIGAILGTSPVTAFIESATGISEGGKTGITAMVTGFAFFISVFFAPIFASIPGWATGGALVIVGSLMIRNVREINWDYPGDAVPAFLTLIIIPLTFNIAYGVIAGVLSYILLNGIPYLIMRATNGRIVPSNNYDSSEQWVLPPGGFIPSWILRLLGKEDAMSEFSDFETPRHSRAASQDIQLQAVCASDNMTDMDTLCTPMHRKRLRSGDEDDTAPP